MSGPVKGKSSITKKIKAIVFFWSSLLLRKKFILLKRTKINMTGRSRWANDGPDNARVTKLYKHVHRDFTNQSSSFGNLNFRIIIISSANCLVIGHLPNANGIYRYTKITEIRELPNNIEILSKLDGMFL